jgi:methanogenic corrinoid protein MtbC1
VAVNIPGMDSNLEILSQKLERALLTLDRDSAEAIVHEAILNELPFLMAGNLISVTLQRIGLLWENGELSLSQVYMTGIICENIIDNILPTKTSSKINQPKMAIAVFEDYHMLGKRIIYSTLKASGYELMDLGGGLTDDALIEVVIREKIEILLLSVLMLPSALHIRNLKEKFGNTRVSLVVGGAPFRLDEELWKEVGADFYGKDSADALEIVSKLMGGVI